MFNKSRSRMQWKYDHFYSKQFKKMIQCGIYIHLEMLIGDIQQSCLFRRHQMEEKKNLLKSPVTLTLVNSLDFV